jgi:hypothetical protein
VPTTPTLTLCDDLVTVLSAAWLPVAPDAARRAYLTRIDLKNVHGRQVIFFPTGYDNAPASRGEDDYTHRITALIFERYEDAADPDEVVPQAWLDERCDFVHDRIVQGLEFFRDGVQPSFNRKLITLSSDVLEMYDAEKLQTQKEFWCAVEMVFRELV